MNICELYYLSVFADFYLARMLWLPFANQHMFLGDLFDSGYSLSLIFKDGFHRT